MRQTFNKRAVISIHVKCVCVCVCVLLVDSKLAMTRHFQTVAYSRDCSAFSQSLAMNNKNIQNITHKH